ncbi:ArnT family glycosyltransferase [Lentzea sp. NPDC051213]|uniref:ArnT family glycosyltransferase n=1 Tax=Lentzea sp. NPDC051213 TaxID=3364126 RepID=UPI0037B5E21F
MRTLVLILAAGALLRLWALGAVGFNSDEAVYAGQAASIAGDDVLTPLFPVFRAHPLLFQTTLSLMFLGGVSDVGARLLPVAFGLGTVVLTYLLGKRMYGPRAGLVAAALLAVMPYHVVVTRQVLLDGPLTFSAVLTAYCVTRFCLDGGRRWLHLAGAALGLAVLTKEIAVVLAAAIVVFFLLRRDIHVPWRTAATSAAVSVAIMAAYPLSLTLAGRGGTGQNYLWWQLFRRPNHGLAFYLETVPLAIGPAVLLLATAGMWLLRSRGTWRETFLLCWILVPLTFFELWPVKGYQYLVVIAPALTLLAARTAVHAFPAWPPVRAIVTVTAVLSLAIPSWLAITAPPSAAFLAGAGGVPKGREAGQWMRANLPEGAAVMTIGPSMANLVRFYGNRKSYALAVSTNPLRRNPSYVPIDNPDRQLRQGELNYVVWDTYSASRTPFYSQQLMTYVHRYRGVLLHTEELDVGDRRTSVIMVYEVRP